MKVTSWKTLFATLIIGGGLVIYALRAVMNKEPAALPWLCFIIYLIGKGFFVSFSPKAFAEDEKRAALGKRLYREKFGIFAPLMPYFPLFAILLDALMVKLCPSTTLLKILSIAILLASVVYAFCLSRWFTGSMPAALAQEPETGLAD